MNPAECEKMIEAAKKAKKKLVCGFQFRFHPSTQFITRARDEGQFGNIMFMKCQALRRRGIPNWGVFGRKELQGGGPMIDIGVHRSEEHTSELQSHLNLVCRLLLEKKKK